MITEANTANRWNNNMRPESRGRTNVLLQLATQIKTAAGEVSEKTASDEDLVPFLTRIIEVMNHELRAEYMEVELNDHAGDGAIAYINRPEGRRYYYNLQALANECEVGYASVLYHKRSIGRANDAGDPAAMSTINGRDVFWSAAGLAPLPRGPKKSK